MPRPTSADPSSRLPSGWRGFARLALDAFIAALIASGVLMLAAFAAISRAEASAPGVSAIAAKPGVPLPKGTILPAGRAGYQHATLVLSDDTLPAFDAPLVATEVDISVAGIVARTRVTQHFFNPTAQWREGLYVFPLPDRAAVDQLHMRIGDRVIEGQVQEKSAARATYAKAKAAGTKAALVESARPNLFTAAVAHLGPNERVTITLEYQETLRYDHGAFRLRYPLAVTPRYTPGGAMAEDGDEDGASPVAGMAAGTGASTCGSAAGGGDDAPCDDGLDEPAPGFPQHAPGDTTVNPVTLAVHLDAGFALSAIASASHDIAVVENAGHRYDVTLAAGVEPADRDFELTWTPDVGAVPGAALFTEDKDGRTYGLLMVLPPSEASSVARAPREATFVVDTSGSMSGASIEQAREAVLYALSRLAPGDAFNVIEFNSHARALFDAPVPVDARSLDRARAFVAGLRADGGTEMKPALERALRAPATPGLVQQVIFVTDGAVGNERELVALIAAEARERRVFTVGIGSGPNTWFLRKAAEAGRGTATFIGDLKDVKERMTALYAKLERPALTGIDAAWSVRADAYPKALPDLYDGEPLVMTVQFDNPAASLSLTGRRGTRAWGELLALSAGHPASGIATLWARDRIESLSDAMGGGDLDEAGRDALRKAIVDTALAHHVVSRFTSLVAVDVTPTLPAGEASLATPIALELPAGYLAPGMLPQTATPMEALAWAALVAALLGLVLAAMSRGNPFPRPRARAAASGRLDACVRAARACC